MRYTKGIAETVIASRQEFDGIFQLANGIENEAIRKGASTFLNSIFLFGECELGIKRAERLEILFRDGKAMKSEMVLDSLNVNTQGIVVLQNAIDEFSEKQIVKKGAIIPKDYEFSQETRKGIDGFISSLKNYLLDCPVKPKDVGEIWEIVQEAGKIKNTGELKKYIADNSKKLLECRRSETRGTDKNIPWWKIAAIAVILGIAIWGVACCLNRWCGCSNVAMAAANIGLALSVLVLWYC